jgi:hypothetical protein
MLTFIQLLVHYLSNIHNIPQFSLCNVDAVLSSSNKRILLLLLLLILFKATWSMQ